MRKWTRHTAVVGAVSWPGGTEERASSPPGAARSAPTGLRKSGHRKKPEKPEKPGKPGSGSGRTRARDGGVLLPGGSAALAAGCTCPAYDNAHGRGRYRALYRSLRNSGNPRAHTEAVIRTGKEYVRGLEATR